ncbi:hypothetical protein [Dickeya zeae]|uniref:hypothetical protein n=1 Tax=Dickeya zeae TaxID=204042 RepID=UPI0003729E9F|nr:hypothetical protein [Dickeya zeae]AJC66875.1 hypothetical protein W909_12635 [Dickeya zeae EC1]
MNNSDEENIGLEQLLSQGKAQKELAEDKLKKRLKQVTPKLFADFLAEKGAAQHCLSCGYTKLSVPESGSFNPADLPDSFEEIPIEELMKTIKRYVTYHYIDPNAYPRPSNCEYRVSCMNCGHVSSYRVNPVLQWIEDKNKAVDDEQ